MTKRYVVEAYVAGQERARRVVYADSMQEACEMEVFSRTEWIVLESAARRGEGVRLVVREQAA